MTQQLRNITIRIATGLALAAATCSTYAVPSALAKGKAAATSTKDDVHPMLRLSKDGYQVMRNVRAARIAIFDGRATSANKYVEAAEKALAKAKVDEKAIKASGKKGRNFIPIDGRLVVTDDFVADAKKAKHIASANQKLKAGKSKDAITELKLAAIGVGFTHVLMPVSQTEDRLSKASTLLKNGKYYEANLALKAAEDGVSVDTVMLIDTPKSKAAKSAAKSETSKNAPAKNEPAKNEPAKK